MIFASREVTDLEESEAEAGRDSMGLQEQGLGLDRSLAHSLTPALESRLSTYPFSAFLGRGWLIYMRGKKE